MTIKLLYLNRYLKKIKEDLEIQPLEDLLAAQQVELFRRIYTCKD
jgi:hypothetical protein